MARMKGKTTISNLEENSLKNLFAAVKNVNSAKNMSEFLDMFFTPEEKRLVLRRSATADLLKKGESYRKIGKRLNISRNTISKIKDILEKRGYGRNPWRKRTYSRKTYRTFRKRRGPFGLKYKGVESIV